MRNEKEISYNIRLNRISIIDAMIENEIMKVMQKMNICIESDGFNLVSERQKKQLIITVNELQEMIQVMFKKGFSEIEAEIKRAPKGNNKLDEIEAAVNTCIASRIEKALTKLEKENSEDAELFSYVSDRKIFMLKFLKEARYKEQRVYDLLSSNTKEEQEER